MKGHPAAVLFLCLDNAVIGIGRDIFQVGIENRDHLLSQREFELGLLFRDNVQEVGKGFYKPRFLYWFQEVIERMAGKCLHHMLPAGSKENQETVRRNLAHLRGCLDAVCIFHVDIHEHDVVLPAADGGQEVLAVGKAVAGNIKAVMICPGFQHLIQGNEICRFIIYHGNPHSRTPPRF